MSPTKEFLTFSAQNSPDATPLVSRARTEDQALQRPTPTAATHDSTTPTTRLAAAAPAGVLSPSPANSSPAYLDPARLVQQTCPPKQTQRLFFPPSGVDGTEAGKENGEGDGVLRQRLLLARRKSLQFAPKIGSPLARGL